MCVHVSFIEQVVDPQEDYLLSLFRPTAGQNLDSAFTVFFNLIGIFPDASHGLQVLTPHNLSSNWSWELH